MAAQGQGEEMPQLKAPLGVHKGYMSPQPTIMIMKEKLSLSGDDFTVKTTTGNPVLRVDGKAFSLSQQKQFFSPTNQHLFTLKHHHFTMFKSTYLESPEGDVIAELKGRASLGKAKIDVSFTNTCAEPAQPVVLEVRGQFFDRSADILWDGQPVAKIRRDFFNAREFFAGGQTYGVEVAANVDLALIAAIVVVWRPDPMKEYNCYLRGLQANSAPAGHYRVHGHYGPQGYYQHYGYHTHNPSWF